MTKTEDKTAADVDTQAIRDGIPVRLWGFAEQIETPVKSMLFGQMVQRATPIVRHYQSDLFHDAMLVAMIDGPTEFWFGARESGTHIAANERDAALIHPISNCTWWKVTLTCERGTWYVTFTQRTPT